MPDKLLTGKRLFSHFIPALIALVFLGLAVTSVQYDDITFDEPAHLFYGIEIMKGKPARETNERFRSTMPVSALNAIPRAAEQLLDKGIKKKDGGNSDVKTGRYVTILSALLLLLYCFRFSVALSSHRTACIVLAFVAFDPNILAHARLVTTDLYNAIGFIAVMYHLWAWLVEKKKDHFYYWCIAIAVAQCCKANNIVLYPVCITIALFYTAGKVKYAALPRMVLKTGAFILLQILIINAAFLFSAPWGLSLAAMNFKSDLFISIQHYPFAKIPLPFPKAFVDTFDLVQYERETFSGTLQNYLMGELRYKTGFWNYYIICYVLKTPVATILLTFAGIIYAMIIRGFRKPVLLYCVWPCLFIFIFLSRSSIQNGYRYLLPVTCMAIIFSSYFLEFITKKKLKKYVPVILSIPLITAIIGFPNYIAYTNMPAGDKKLVYRFFADSNLNWGQRQTYLDKFMAAHPDYIFEPANPVKAMIVVDINNLVGLREPGKFKWLRNNYLPMETIESCYLIYDTR